MFLISFLLSIFLFKNFIFSLSSGAGTCKKTSLLWASKYNNVGLVTMLRQHFYIINSIIFFFKIIIQIIQNCVITMYSFIKNFLVCAYLVLAYIFKVSNSIQKYTYSAVGWWLATPDLVPEPFWITALHHNGYEDMDVIVINNLVSLYIWLVIGYSIYAISYKRFDQGWVLSQAAATHSSISKGYYNHFIWWFDLLYLCFAEDDVWFTHFSTFTWALYAYYVSYFNEIHEELLHELEDVFISHEIIFREYGTVFVRNIRVRNMMIRSNIMYSAFNMYFCIIMQCALLNVELWEGDVDVPEDGGLLSIDREPLRIWPVTLPDDYRFHDYDSVIFTNHLCPNDTEIAFISPRYDHDPEYEYWMHRTYKNIVLEKEEPFRMGLYGDGDDYNLLGLPYKYYTPGLMHNAWIFRYHPAFLLDYVEPGYFFKEFSFVY